MTKLKAESIRRRTLALILACCMFINMVPAVMAGEPALKGATGNWQIVDAGGENVYDDVRLTKTVSATENENEFLVHIAVDAKCKEVVTSEVLTEYLEQNTGLFKKLNSNQVPDPAEGEDTTQSCGYIAKIKKAPEPVEDSIYHYIFEFTQDGDLVAQPLICAAVPNSQLYLQVGSSYIFLANVGNQKNGQVQVNGETVHEDSEGAYHITIELTPKAHEALLEVVESSTETSTEVNFVTEVSTADLITITDPMGDCIVFDGLQTGAKGITGGTPDGSTVSWTLDKAALKTLLEDAPDDVTTVKSQQTIETESGTKTITVMTKTWWVEDAVDFTYKVTLDTDDEDFVNNQEYPVNGTTTLNETESGRYFPIPVVKGVVYKIDVTVENGSATPSESPIKVSGGADQTIQFSADTGYRLDSVTVDGTAASLTGNSYTFEDIDEDHTIVVKYVKNSYDISVTVVNGTSDPDATSAPISATAGENKTITFTAAEGYALDTVTVDEETAVLTGGAYTFTDVSENHDIKVVYAADTNDDGIPDKYQAFVTYKVAHGTWNGTDSAPKTVCIDLYDYTAGEWVLKDPAATLGTTIPTGMIPATGYDAATGSWDTAITASTAAVNGAVYEYDFDKQEFTVNVTVENGTSDPAETSLTANYGDSKTITFAAAEGYALDTVTVDSTAAVLTGDAYTFSNIEADHAIKVVYAADTNDDGIPDKYQAFVTYKIENGTWNGTDTAPKTVCIDLYDYAAGEWVLKDPAATLGTTIPTGMIPATGYDSENGSWNTAITAATAAVDGAEYTFSYADLEYEITVEVVNGTADPAGTTHTVSYGNNQTITFAAAEGYVLDTVTVDSAAAVLTGDAYTFSNVTADHAIKVVFAADTNDDGIPDKYQAFVTYKVAHGTWNGTDTAPKTVCIDLYDCTAGEWVLKTPAATLGTTIPAGMTPATGYDAATGSWDTAITASTAAVNGAVYEYDFDKIEKTITVSVNNGTSDPDET